MSDKRINTATKTGRVYELIFQILEDNPNGVPWSRLNKMVEGKDPTLHPKTINGCVWKLTDKFPDKVYKPSKGLFRLVKYK